MKYEIKEDMTEVKLAGTKKEIQEAMKTLYLEDFLDCDHEITEQEEQDDTRWLAPDGLHERSNPDITRCLICGAWYNDGAEEWQYD